MAFTGIGALRDMARLARPSSLGSTLLMETNQCIVVFDKFPKAKYHFLVLPRILPDGLGEKALDSLSSVLAAPGGKEVIDKMAEVAEEVVEMVRDEMVKTEGFEWGINCGFHAVPSMKHVHLHVISDDLVAPGMKIKKHYNSFRPDLGFFVSLREVQGWLQDGGHLVDRAERLKLGDSLLSTSLACFKCGEDMANMPALKRHLDDEFAKEKRKAGR